MASIPRLRGHQAESELLRAALEYAERNWPVFPIFEIDGPATCACGKEDCDSPGKHPRMIHGLYDATVDTAQSRQWWGRWPCANVAIRTGREARLVVLDVDPEHGGDESLAILEDHHQPLPETLRTRTGGGGQHFLFAHPGDRKVRSVSKLGGYSGIDLRADGGYIVAPPSNHWSGGAYQWQLNQPLRAQSASLPAWILELLDRPAVGNHRSAEPGSGRISVGQRSSTLTSLAGTMRRRAMSREAIEAALMVENRVRCEVSLRDDEVRRIAASVSRYAPWDGVRHRRGTSLAAENELILREILR